MYKYHIQLISETIITRYNKEMQTSKFMALALVLEFFFSPSLIAASTSNNDRKPYIVYMGELPDVASTTAVRATLASHHNDILSSTIGDKKIARESIIHSYGWSFNGFAARLLPDEASRLAENENVVSVFPDTVRELHTSRSWDFLGMPETVRRRHSKESNIIVGTLDTGIWPDSPSFDDEGFGPPPVKWKGKCQKGVNFTGCNNKIIGARYFNLRGLPGSNDSPVDTNGHGTHTSSTIVGIPVEDASLYNIAKGTIRGGVPSARIAVYKVCWPMGCTDMDLLAGFDTAIADGVDIISLSIGGYARTYFNDAIAIGAFHAMRRGILTTCSVGNSGPALSSVQNVAPWITTVGASSMDRQIKAAVKLGNGKKFSGLSINTFSPKKKIYPLTSGSLAANDNSTGKPSECAPGSLIPSKVKNKIVYCEGESSDNTDTTIKELGGAGIIMSSDTDVAFTHIIPATDTNSTDGEKIIKYINSTKNARAVLYKSRAVNITAPVVASFSSRGPQSISPNILKPDLVAPGLSILAAYPPMLTISDVSDDNRRSKYNIISGTSMACPHVTAAAAYVKCFHPEWSPAMIRSALMTTATPMKIKQGDAELGSGAGQINPTRALNPGLVYDIDEISYIRFLCKEGYNSTTIRLLTGDKRYYNCSSLKPAEGTDGLNYPSMHLQIKNELANISAVFHRTVTHVSYGRTVYKAKVKAPKNLKVEVIPKVLKFERARTKKSFKVIVKGNFEKTSRIVSASLKWVERKHKVTSPIVIFKYFSD